MGFYEDYPRSGPAVPVCISPGGGESGHARNRAAPIDRSAKLHKRTAYRNSNLSLAQRTVPFRGVAEQCEVSRSHPSAALSCTICSPHLTACTTMPTPVFPRKKPAKLSCLSFLVRSRILRSTSRLGNCQHVVVYAYYSSTPVSLGQSRSTVWHHGTHST